MINKLKEDYEKNKEAIQQRLKEFSQFSFSEKDYFYELCFCLMTPGSKAKNCDKAVKILKENDFLNKAINPARLIKGLVRFHNNKGKYLIDTKKNYKNILNLLIGEPKKIRENLIKNVRGMSYKESSHFLRNIGYKDLAILDRHILKNLVRHKVIEKIPKDLDKDYLMIERKFYVFSKLVEIPMDELDLLFWQKETGEIFK